MTVTRPRPPRRQRDAAAAPSRFSPLSAPQRAHVEAFLARARPWAMREARRSYSHLPPELHEQALEQAFLDVRTGADTGADRRALYAALADALTAALRRAHTGWCLNQAHRPWEPQDIGVDERLASAVARFIDDGLAGLERAVLQLEIGAGRDSATARAALRLGPRQYGRHREEALSKLRAAIAGIIGARACEQHVEAVTLAATGDRGAAAALRAGPGRCRSCAREAGSVRRVLRERLALAPWPLLIKPAGLLAAKLGAAGAVAGGKTAAAVLTAAALTSGGIALVEPPPTPPSGSRAAVAQPAPPTPATFAARSASLPAAVVERRSGDAGERRKRRGDRAAARRRSAKDHTGALTPPATPEPLATAAPAPDAPVRQTVDALSRTVRDVERRIGDTVAALRGVQTQPDGGLPDLSGTLGGATGAVEGLLQP